jgi:hypothetical protein
MLVEGLYDFFHQKLILELVEKLLGTLLYVRDQLVVLVLDLKLGSSVAHQFGDHGPPLSMFHDAVKQG